MRNPYSRLRIAALALLAFPTLLAAQGPAAQTYSGEPFVAERTAVVYSMNANGTGYMQRTVAVKVQSESALQQLGIVTMGFAANSSHVEFHYVRVRRPDGSVTETPIAGAMEQPQPATVAAPFYSDLKSAQLPVKNLQVGDTLEWEARVVLTKAEVPDEFWGAESFITEGSVVREESIELRMPATKAVTVWTNPSLSLHGKESRDGDQKVYRWEDAALTATVGPEADAAKDARKRHVLTAGEELDSERGKLPSVAWTTFPGWAAVGEWYRTLEESRAVPDDEIKAKAAELTAGKTTQEEKVRALYEYVSTQIRYIGVAFGVGRYQPHQAVEVLHNQYGDCKDKATLLSAMLAAAGVDSDAALIGAGVRFNQAVPSPAAFNHLITHLKLNGQDVWLDSTEEVAPYRMMYAVLRDREALVVPQRGAAMLMKTPANLPFAAFQSWTAKGSLDANGISDSQITVESRGDDELALRTMARQIGPGEYDELTQRLLVTIGYGGKESHAQFSRPDALETPFSMSFGYHREKAGDWDNLKTVPQLAPVSLPTVDEKEPPVASINLGVPRVETSTAEMKLPAGWTVELPEAVHEKSPYATYDLRYRFDNGTLYSERKIVVLEGKVPQKDWKTYKQFADAVSLGNETYVQLRSAGEAKVMAALNAGKSSAEPRAVSDPKAAEMVTQAVHAIGRKEYPAAEVLLNEAKQVNPQERMLWSGFGLLAENRGNKSEALADLLAELHNHPDSYEAYPRAVRLELATGDKAQAKETLQEWSTQYPTSPAPLIQLSQMQLADNQASVAEETAQRAMDMMTDYGRQAHPELQLTLGLAQMHSGMREKGVATLTELLKTTNNAGFINNAAFELADANQELTLDEQKQRIAVAELTKQTQSLNVNELPEVARAKTSLLIAAWDTMGWILFREGKVREARPYIQAAWMNREDDLLKKHLDAVNAKLGAAMGKSATDGQELRSFSLGPPGDRHGVAEYRLLIVHGTVEQSKPAGAKTIEGAEEVIRRAKLRGLIPEGSDAKLVRNAMLDCYAAECQLVLIP